MSSQFKNFAGIFRLALDGKKDEAIEAGKAERTRLSALKAQITSEFNTKLAVIDNDLAMLNTILPPDTTDPLAAPKGIINSAMTGDSIADTAKHRLLEAEIKEKRDSAIIEAAKALGGMYEQFTTVSIANELQQKGIETGVPDNRISTVISRLLLRHEGEFERVTTGVYKIKNEHY